MSEQQTVAQSLRLLGVTAERIAAAVADRVEDASVRVVVRQAVMAELRWLHRLIDEAADVERLRLTDAERKLLERLEISGALDGFMLSAANRQTLRGLLARLGGEL